MTTTIEGLASLRIGGVDAVAPDSITVHLDLDAPQTTALNAGVPSSFPRLNGYVVIPKESGAVVGLVVWLGIERANAIKVPRSSGSVGLLDLPFPQRRMIVTPVGTLVSERDAADSFRMERGVTAFPSVGDDVLVPTRTQLRAIVEPTGPDRRVHIGEAVLAGGARVSIDPDKLFGRHVAVLGNTGSGKSCTVAGLIRWSLEAAHAARTPKSESPNARFIVLDPNGEYSGAFDGVPGGVRRFRVPPVDGAGASELCVPAWMWNSHEWSAFAGAAAKVQRPMLVRALREVRAASAQVDETEKGLVRLVYFLRSKRAFLQSNRGRTLGNGDRRALGHSLVNLAADLAAKSTVLISDPSTQHQMETASEEIHRVASTKRNKDGWFDSFADTEIENVIVQLDEIIDRLPIPRELALESEDAPIAFRSAELVDHLETLAEDDSGGSTGGFIATLVLRIRTMLADQRMAPIVAPLHSSTFEDWLTDIIGADGAANGSVAVIDLSLVPSDVVHTVVAVLARVVFEATQRYRRHTSKELPTTLVLEEAHSFVMRHEGGAQDTLSPAQMCLHTFERIAREGRKFGLGLMLSSQRPSEISQTVLAQCNTFILHRLVNDRDQDLVTRLVPDNLSGLLKELPTLPTRHALMLGWASALPVLMKVRELPAPNRPQSSDPAFWNTWTGKESRPIDWAPIVHEWTGGTTTADTSGERDNEHEPEDVES